MIIDDIKYTIALLNSKISAKIYTGQIPESVTDDAVLLTNISNPDMGRSIDGSKRGNYTVYRATIVSNDYMRLLSIIKEFDDMDNTRSKYFQRITTQVINIEDKTTEQPYQRAFVDITVIKR